MRLRRDSLEWTGPNSTFLRLVAALAIFGAGSRLGAHSIPMSASEMVRRSSRIVVAVVDGSAVRWNDRHNLILTDYSLRIEDRLKGESPSAFSITVIGGTLDGETQTTCLSAPLEVGGRYLLLLQGSSERALTPFVGGVEGIVREMEGAAVSVDAMDFGIGAGQKRDRPSAHVEFSALVERVRGMACGIADFAESESIPSTPNQMLPSKSYLTTRGGPMGSADSLPATDSTSSGRSEVARDDGSGARVSRPDYSYAHRADFPVAFNDFPPSFAPWSPEDQYMMSRWNIYGDVFRVYASPTGTWSWGNGIFDLAGWPSNADMISAFGQGWDATTLGITFARWQSGPIIEADIALNPAFGWTLDDEYGTRDDNGVWGFHQTLLHELGHSWGLHHPFNDQDPWWDSVMDYSPKRYRFPILTADDVNAVRNAYPGIAIHDGFLTTYTTGDCAGCALGTVGNNPVYYGNGVRPVTIMPGSAFSLVRPFKLENLGTDAIVDPIVDVFLTPRRMDYTGAIPVGTWNYYAQIPPFTVQPLNPGPVSIPTGTPQGIYYVALNYRDSDGNVGNNASWTDWNVTLGVFDQTLGVQGIAPGSGSSAGGTPFTLFGSGFRTDTLVFFSGRGSIGGVDTASLNEIFGTTPDLTPGTLNGIVVRNPDSSFAVLPNAWFSDFLDVPGDYLFHGGVEKVVRSGIATGCGGGRYCPEDPVTRASMAVFLLRGEHGATFQPGPATGSIFSDVKADTYLAKWIEALAKEKITTGCGGRYYCPSEAVTRASMAVFLLRARHGAAYRPPHARGDVFRDVPLGTFLIDWIEQLAAEGITSGCGAGIFCPNQIVTRGEMAVFLARAFGQP